MTMEILRYVDGAIGLFWLWALLQALLAGRIGGKSGFRSNRSERPGQYWFLVFMFALMAVHFIGLALMPLPITPDMIH